MLNFTSSLSALRASQVALDTIANNIANANTPGYHRQSVSLVDEQPAFIGGFWTGTGVRVASINQIASQGIESSLTRSISTVQSNDQQLQYMRRVESFFAPGDASIDGRLQALLAEINQLQGDANNHTQRQLVVNRASAFADQVRSTSHGLRDLQRTAREQITHTVDLVNSQLRSLSVLSQQISRARAAGGQPNDLLDQHQQLVNQIAQSIDIQVIDRPQGFNYQLAGDTLSISQREFQLQVSFAADGQVAFATPSGFPLEFHGGQLAALQQVHNQTISRYQVQLDQFATTTMAAFDRVHSTGMGVGGGFQYLTSHRAVEDHTVPLADAGLPFEIQDGQLFLSVTDQSTGLRTLHSIDVNPRVQTLEDLASAISSIDNLQAIVSQQTGTLAISARDGFRFDFAGRLESVPDRTNISGDAAIQFHGNYTGEQNDQWDFHITQRGTVGVDEGMLLQVTNQAGAVIAEVNVGLGYEPGVPIEIADGVSITIESGVLDIGDRFSTQLVADSDTADVLVGLGLNTFFQGTDAEDIRVTDLLRENSDLLATSRSGEVGDNSNADRLHRLGDQPLFGGDRDMSQYLALISSQTAIEVAELNSLATSLTQAQENLLAQRNAISGVDPNEEMVNMLRFQQSFQAAVRVISTIDETMSELMNIIR